MSDNPFPHSAPGFDEPLQLLLACHGRMEQHCALLLRVVEHLEQQGLDDEARTAIGRIRHYFNSAAVHHHHDEEEDLFPMLTGVEELLARLQAQHRELEALWQALDHSLAGLLDGAVPALDALREDAARFVAGYREHIAVENREVLPRAAQQLHGEQLLVLGAAMSRRRKGAAV